MPNRGTFGLLISIATLLLTACSTANYTQPVKQFSETTGAANKAMADLDKQVAQASLDVALDSVARDSTSNFARPAGNCGMGEHKDCNMGFTLNVEGVEQKFTRADYSNPLRGAVAVMAAIYSYADALSAIVDADTTQKVQSGLDSVAGSVTTLVKTAAPAAGIGDIPNAAGEAVKWVAGQYIETVKLDALRRATDAARKPIAEAKIVFDDSVQNSNKLLIYNLDEDFKKAQMAVDQAKKSDIRGAEKAYVLAGNALADAEESGPAAIAFYASLVEAHTKLADAVNGNDRITLQSVIVELTTLDAQAQELNKIVQDLRNAISKADTAKKPV